MQRRRMLLWVFVFLGCLLMQRGDAAVFEKVPGRVEGFALKESVLTPYLKKRIYIGKNMIFCANFQAAWDVLKKDLTKEPVEIEGKPVAPQMFAEDLVGAEGMNEGEFLAFAGSQQDGASARAEKLLKEKFNEIPGIDLSLSGANSLLVYSFFSKDIVLRYPLESLEAPLNFNGKVTVKAQGIREFVSDQAHQLRGEELEISYVTKDDFMLRLSSPKEEEIILAKVSPKNILFDTVNYVIARLDEARWETLRDGDSLAIPEINFDIVDRFIEIETRNLANRGLEHYFLEKAIQSVKFCFTQTVPPLPAETEAAVSPGVSPRQYLFDKPFLLMIRKTGSRYPYFAMWVANAELMVKD